MQYKITISKGYTRNISHPLRSPKDKTIEVLADSECGTVAGNAGFITTMYDPITDKLHGLYHISETGDVLGKYASQKKALEGCAAWLCDQFTVAGIDCEVTIT
jgi:hypothetical protein